MAEFPPPASRPPSPPAAGQPVQSLVTLTLVIYALFGLTVVLAFVSAGVVVSAPLVAVTGIVAIVMIYVKRDDARATWLASHYRWLLRTFWYSLLWSIVGSVFFVLLWWVLGLGILLAYIVWFVAGIWVVYRILKGYLLFKESRPVPDM